MIDAHGVECMCDPPVRMTTPHYTPTDSSQFTPHPSTGTDLDYMIKTQKVIPERDARAIMMQILAGLRYLNTPSGSRQVRHTCVC